MDIVLSIQLKTAQLLNFIGQKKCYLFNLLWTFAAGICEEFFFYFARFAFDTTSTGWDCGLTLSIKPAAGELRRINNPPTAHYNHLGAIKTKTNTNTRTKTKTKTN